MPPTVFALARHEVLKPEAIAFMHRMRSQGVHMSWDIFDGTQGKGHGFEGTAQRF